MEQTYAEIEDTFVHNFTAMKTTPNCRQPPRRRRHSKHDELDITRLPIEFRYPKKMRTSSSTATKKRSLASKSSSSGYSSASSISSITTVVNGARPFRPKFEATKETGRQSEEEEEDIEELEDDETSLLNKVIGEESGEEGASGGETPKLRACCIECREKEIRQELDLESHHYANLSSLQKPLDPYVFLMTSMLKNFQKEEGGRKVAKVQQKIEKVLRLKPREPFNVDHKPTFDMQVATFGSDVMIRLRAVSDVAPETYCEISAKFCEALHHGAPNNKGLKGIVKGMKNLLNF